MADQEDPVYDHPGTTDENESKSSSPSSSSTSPIKSSFARGDNANPGRSGAGGLWHPHGDRSGTNTGGGSPGSTLANSDSSSSDTPSRGDVKDKEESAGKQPEEDDNFAQDFDDEGKKPSRRKRLFKVTKKKAAIGIITLMLGGGGIGLLSISSGPLEAIHIAQLMDKFHFASLQNAQNSRIMKIARYIRDPSKPQNSRLGIVGNVVADKLEAKIHEATGLTPLYDKTNGKFLGYSIDRNHSDFKDKTVGQIKDQLATDYGIDRASVVESGGKISFNPDPGGLNTIKRYRVQTAFSRNTLKAAGFSYVGSYAASRVETKRAGWNFHPIKVLDANVQNAAIKLGKKGIDKLKEQVRTDEVKLETNGVQAESTSGKDSTPKDKNGNPTDPASTAAAQATAGDVNGVAGDASSTANDINGGGTNANDGLASKLNTKAVAGGAAGVAGILCVAQGLDQLIQQGKFTKAMLPMMRKAGAAISRGNQAQSGQDFTAFQLGLYQDPLNKVNSAGQVVSTWDQARSIQAELGQPLTGPDIPKAGQVFNSTSPLNFVNSVPGLSAICSAFNSPLGIVVSIISGPVSFLFNTLITNNVVSLATNIAAGWLSGAPIDPQAAGADFGNYVNYGSRLLANDQFASAGGVPVSTPSLLVLKDINNNLDQTDFKSKSLAYRIFNTRDSRTLAAHFIDSQGSSSPSQTIAHMATGFGNIFASVLKAPTTLFSGLVHAAPAPYNYNGLKAVDFTAQDLGNPLFDNPFDNACYVVGKCKLSHGGTIAANQGILAGPNGQTFIDRISKCFNDKVSVDADDNWSIDYSSGGATNMHSSDYPAGDCTDSNPDWKRVRFWILDTNAMEGFDCSQGSSSSSDQSCTDMGFGSTPGSGTPTPTPPPPPTTGGYFTITGADKNRISDPNGEFIPYGTSIIDDLDQLDQGSLRVQASDAQIQASAQYWHVNTIRLQVSEITIMSNPTAGKDYNDTAMQRLGTEIDEIEALGKIPIINDNLLFTDNTQTAPTNRTKDFWKAVTEYFASKNNPKYANIIFDIFNEPHNVSWGVWQKGNTSSGGRYVGMQNVVDAIRKTPNSLNSNLIMVEGPNTATRLDQLDNYPITGDTIAFAYHHVDLNDPSSWDKDIGLNLKTKVPIIDGEWAQFASSTRPECKEQGPKNIPAYFDMLRQNHIGLIFWSLEPGVGVALPPGTTFPTMDFLIDSFPKTPQEYSQPNSFLSNYTCATGPNGQDPALGQGAGTEVMNYFNKYGS